MEFDIQLYNKKFLVAAVAFIFVAAIFAVGMIFFKRENPNVPVLNQPNRTSHFSPGKVDNEQSEKKENKKRRRKVTEKERVKTIAETFVSGYYSYRQGDFSNIESRYYSMTDEMRKREEEKVNKMKEKIVGKPKEYKSVRTTVISSNFIEYDNVKAILKMEIKVDKINGAWVTSDEVPEIYPYTSALIDSNKKVHVGDIDDLITETINKTVQVALVKVDNKWKVDSIKTVM